MQAWTMGRRHILCRFSEEPSACLYLTSAGETATAAEASVWRCFQDALKAGDGQQQQAFAEEFKLSTISRAEAVQALHNWKVSFTTGTHKRKRWSQRGDTRMQ